MFTYVKIDKEFEFKLENFVLILVKLEKNSQFQDYL